MGNERVRLCPTAPAIDRLPGGGGVRVASGSGQSGPEVQIDRQSEA